GGEGSLFFRASFSQNHAKTGASAITKIGWTNWNQLAGKFHPSRLRSVFLSANKLSDDPACSNDAQKIADATNKTITTAERLRSSCDHFPKKISHENTTTEITSRAQPTPFEINSGFN